MDVISIDLTFLFMGCRVIRRTPELVEGCVVIHQQILSTIAHEAQYVKEQINEIKIQD